MRVRVMITSKGTVDTSKGRYGPVDTGKGRYGRVRACNALGCLLVLVVACTPLSLEQQLDREIEREELLEFTRRCREAGGVVYTDQQLPGRGDTVCVSREALRRMLDGL